MKIDANRTLPWDWHPETIPANVAIDETAYVESSFSFHHFRSEATVGMSIGRGSAIYDGTMFDVGPCGRVTIGDFALIHGARMICDAAVEVGDYALISWNVVLADTYRFPIDPVARRHELEALPLRRPRVCAGSGEARPVRVGSNAWIGFDVCVLPGVTIGDGAIIGARSVVADNVPPYAVAAGNPARVVRWLDEGEVVKQHGV
jgi:acetyltransferase-like isoleucine patch superfamily enzyme